MKQLTQYLKKVQNAVFAAVMVLSMGIALVPHASAATATSMTTSFVNDFKVSLTFDDGLKSALLAADTLKPYGYAGTDYIITDCVGMTTAPNTCDADPNDKYMTWPDIKNLHDNYGWEIGSHTKTHPLTAAVDNPSLTDAQLDEEMKGSQKAIFDNTGITATEFATPYGDYDNRSIAAAAKYYGSYRAFQDYTQPKTADDLVTPAFPYYSPRSTSPYNDYLLTVADVQGNISVAQVKTMIDTAKTNHQWLVLVFHKIVSGTASTAEADYQYSASQLAEIAGYLKTTNAPVTDIAHGRVTSETNLFANPNLDIVPALAAAADDPTKTTVWSTRYSANVKQDTAGHGNYPSPTSSVVFTATTQDVELLSPHVAVDAAQSYILKNFINAKDLTAGRVSFYIDEYDVNGTWVSGQNNPSWNIVSDGTAEQVRVGDVNFIYTPTSAAVTQARLQVIVGSPTNNTTGTVYYDSPQWVPLNKVGVTTPVVDTIAPVISAAATTTASTSTTITWTTDEAADSQVVYGLDSTYGTTTTLNSALATAHSVTLIGLTANTTYHYQVWSKDAAGNLSKSADLTFTTAVAGTLIAGDVDGDGKVGIEDATKVALHWDMTGATRADGDVDGDGKVGIEDATLIALNWSTN